MYLLIPIIPSLISSTIHRCMTFALSPKPSNRDRKRWHSLNQQKFQSENNKANLAKIAKDKCIFYWALSLPLKSLLPNSIQWDLLTHFTFYSILELSVVLLLVIGVRIRSRSCIAPKLAFELISPVEPGCRCVKISYLTIYYYQRTWLSTRLGTRDGQKFLRCTSQSCPKARGFSGAIRVGPLSLGACRI